jgi:hypothetical protein
MLRNPGYVAKPAYVFFGTGLAKNATRLLPAPQHDSKDSAGLHFY